MPRATRPPAPPAPPYPGRPPCVAVTASTRLEGDVRRVRLNAAYLDAIEQAGALPLVIPPLGSIAQAARLLEGVQGLLLTGGEDVEPSRYGARAHPKLGETHAARDATEIALVDAARRAALPTLAICRGIQLLNAAFGGSLIQDIPSERPGAIDHDPPAPRSARVHTIQIEPDSHLARALGITSLEVNSFHHQAVDRVAEGFRATAWAPDGVIEGLEWSGEDWWAVAVQWHPEELTGADTGLFQAFVARAAGIDAPPSLAPSP